MPNQEKWATERAQRLRHEMTDAEKSLWRHLRTSQLQGMKFRRQYPIGNFIVDFYCLEHGVVIELDGSQHADNEDDRKRDACLRAQGLMVLRFWNAEVLENMSGVLEAIAEVFTALALTPTLSRRERE